jgi:hypothetical protein
MSEDSVWSGLGSEILGSSKIDRLSELVSNIQVELMGSMEALSRRVGELEQKMNILIERGETPAPSVSPHAPMESSVYMFMSQDELGLTPDKMEYVDVGDVADDTRTVKSGFVAPPPQEDVPEDEDVSGDLPTPSDEIKEAYRSYKNKENKWIDFVRVCGGMKKASHYRQVLSEDID